MKLQDQLFSTIIEKAILLGKNRIQMKLQQYSSIQTSDFFKETTSEVVDIFDQHQKILAFIFTQIESLPKTKKVLIQENLIIDLLKKDIMRRFSHKLNQDLLHSTIEQYISVLTYETLYKKSELPAIKKKLVNLLETNLSEKPH